MSGIPVAALTENYEALKILRFSHLNDLATSIETFLDDNVTNNFEQLAQDLFGTYVFTNDGVASLVTPIFDTVSYLDENETYGGAKIFDAAVTFNDTVTSTGTFTSSAQERVRVYLTTANQAIANTTDTAISFAAETYDNNSLHDNSTNPSRITIPVGASGLYLFDAQVTFAANATGIRKLLLFKNGSQIAQTKELTCTAGDEIVLHLSNQLVVAANDYFELKVYQSSGGSLDVVFGEYVTYFSAMKVW